MKIIRLIVCSAIVIGTGAGLAYSEPWKAWAAAQKDPRPQEKNDRHLLVEAERVESVASWESTVQYSGIVKAKRKSELGFERGGRVDRILVEKGDRVKKGQVLAVLNTEVILSQIRKLKSERDAAAAGLAEMKAGPRKEIIDAARATVEELEIQRELANRKLTRRQKLANSEALSKEDLDQTTSEVARLDAGIKSAKNTLRDLELGTRQEKIENQQAILESLAHAIDSAQIELEHSSLVSPFDGAVMDRHLDEGVVVAPGTVAFLVSEIDDLQAHFGVSASIAEELEVGNALQVIVREKRIPARLKTVVPQVDDETRTVGIIVELKPKESQQVLAGDLARLELVRSQETEGFWLNTVSVMKGPRGLWECFVLEPTSTLGFAKVTRRAVEILHTSGDQVLVRGALREGDIVVSDAVHRLVAGQTVQYRLPELETAQERTE